MDLNLKNKNALVCGSSKGIGKAAAIELARLGANVTLAPPPGAAKLTPIAVEHCASWCLATSVRVAESTSTSSHGPFEATQP